MTALPDAARLTANDASMPTGIVPATIVRRDPMAGPTPLSLSQQRLWLLDRLDPGSSVYNEPVILRLKGRLDLTALERALAEIIRRHEALRTIFPECDGQPIQVVTESGTFTLPVVRLKNRLRGLSEPEQTLLLQLRLLETVRIPFDPTRDRLIRATLLRLDGREHILVVTFHHLVIDGWSIGVFLRELGELYSTFVAGQSSPLPEPRIQYGDFAAWQQARLAAGRIDQQIAYWTTHLAGLVPLTLPTDFLRQIDVNQRGARFYQPLPIALVPALKALAREERVTLFMLLLAAFQALLSRYTGSTDIAVGVPIAGRTRVETEELIGFFVNTLVMRSNLGGDPSFREALTRVRETALTAYSNQEAPFERIIAGIHHQREARRSPFVSVMFALQNAPRTEPQLAGLTVNRLDFDPGDAKFDLTCLVREIAGSLRVDIEYDTDLFRPETITRLVGHYQTLLAGVVADPDCPLSQLPLLTEEERHQLLVEWNATTRDFPATATIADLFEEHAARTPTAVAVVGGEETVTYSELNRRANRLAHFLRQYAVGPDVIVGLCLERGPSMILAMLATLKAGGAYLPIDPAAPPDRARQMLTDAGAPVVVIDRANRATLAATSAHVIDLDLDASAIAGEPDTNPTPIATANNLAYVIYTSGSTGMPKGVAVPHRAVLRLVKNTDFIRLGPRDAVAHAANIAFDATTFEVWGALLNGGRVVVIPSDALLSPRELVAAVRRHEVTALFVTTALFHQIAREAPAGWQTVHTLLFGGEACDPRWVAEVVREGPPSRLLHVYGPTETTTFATWYLVERIEPNATTIPIGRPLANTTAHVLDPTGHLLPIGIPGELYIGGPGVARGYLNRAELTAARFVPDPFSSTPHASLYRTGDLVRRLPDGNLEFLGRLDRQVKIRGFRVEPGEVEAALMRHPEIDVATVVAGRDPLGGVRLIAYLVPRGDASLESNAYRAFLRQNLPDYMIPTAFVPLPALPLTPQGKIDESALPTPDPAFDSGSRPPGSPLEQQLAIIWCNLLGIDQVGMDDDFFAIGGHSLLVTRAVARIRSDLGIDLPPRVLFEAPTIGALAERIGKLEPGVKVVRAASAAALVCLQPGREHHPLFVVPGGDGGAANLFKLAQLARRIGQERAVYGFFAKDAEYLDDDVQEWVTSVAAGYAKEIRARQPIGPYLIAGTCVGGILAFATACQLLDQGQEVARLILFDVRCPDGPATAVPELTRQRAHERSTLKRTRRAERADRHLDNRRIGDHRAGPIVVDDWPSEEEELAPARRRLYEFQPRSYPAPISLFLNEEWHRRDPTAGWGAVATGGLAVEVLPGRHGDHLMDQMDALAARLRELLDTIDPIPPGKRH